MNQEQVKTNPKMWWILVATSLVTFMATLDGSIVNIAMPQISKHLNIPMNKAEWIVSIYIATICVFLILFGRLADQIGKVKIFQIGTLIFTAGSLICGLSNELNTLLIGRVIQAFGSSMTMATNFGIITETFPLHLRGRALGLLGSFVSMGSIAGPGLGGLILARFSWHSIFLINIPVGVLAFIFGFIIFPKQHHTKTKLSIDWLGFGSFALSLIALFVGIFWGQEIGFAKMQILILFIVFVIFMTLFIRHEKKVEVPLVDLKIFKNIDFSIALICSLIIFSTGFFYNVMMPFYLQNTLQLSTFTSGLILMGIPIAMIIVAPLSGALSDNIGAEIITFIGLVILTIANLYFTFILQTYPLWLLVASIVLTGVGVGMFQSPNNTIVMSSVPKQYLGIAGSLNSMARNLGMILGLSLATTLLYAGMSAKAGHRVVTYVASHPEYFMYGMHMTFMVSCALIFSACLITGWRLVKHHRESVQLEK